MWSKIGGVVGVLTVLGLIIALVELMQNNRAAKLQDSAQNTQIAVLEKQLNVQSEMATLQASNSISGPSATAAALRLTELESTAAALATVQAGGTGFQTNPPQDEGPLRDHQTVSIGTGVFEKATFSDGTAPYDENWLWANNHFNIQRIQEGTNPDGCGSAQYQVNKIWIGVAATSEVRINGSEIGTITSITPVQRHGFIVDVSLNVGDVICVSPIPDGGFHIIFGPDIYYHHDTYCYRGNC